MKLLFVSSSLARSDGWGKVSCELIERFIRDDHCVSLLTDDSSNVQHLDCTTFIRPCFRSKQGGWSRYWNVHRDRAACTDAIQSDPDVIFCLTEDLLPLSHSLAGQHRKLVNFGHGTFSITTLTGATGRLYLKALRRCDLIFCNSQYTRNKLLNRSDRRLTSKTHVTPLGANIALLEDQYRQSLTQRKKQILAVGQLKTRKATLESIVAFSRFHQDFPEYEFHIVGSLSIKAYVDRVKAEIAKHSLQDHVKLIGKASQSELFEYYKTSRLLLMPSINENDNFEGFGLVHLEANSFGMPTIGSNDCGHEEVIIDGSTGYLTPQHDVNAIHGAMTKILVTDDVWSQYSQRAYQHSLTMTWERCYQNCLDHMSELSFSRKSSAVE